MTKLDAFDFVNSINSTKKDIMRGTENDDLAEKSYVPWLTNNALSYFPDTLYHANIMNSNYHLDNRLQYSYLLNIVRPKKRFSKWAKKSTNKDVENLSKYYNYSMTKAKQVLSLFSKEQLKQLEAYLNPDKHTNK